MKLHKLIVFLGVLLAMVSLAAAQNYRTLPQGTTIKVRTDTAIPAKPALGTAYTATVSEDVVDGNGNLIIPRGSPAQLIAESNGKDDVALDLTNVMVNGQNYNLLATKSGTSNLPGGIGANTRTAKYVGGGAVIGTILGAIFGGGKGAAIGALAGAAAGTGAQVYTGRNKDIPAETVLSYKTAQDLSMQPGQPYNNGGLQQRPPQQYPRR